MGGGEDDQRRAVEQLEHLEPIQLRHLDVQQQQVGIVLGHGIRRRESVRPVGHDLDVLVSEEELAEKLAGRRLVIDDDGPDHRGSSMYTRNLPSVSTVSSRAIPSETVCSRPRAFCRPTRSPRLSTRSGSAGLSIRIRSVPSCSVASMSIVPPSTTEAMPCRTAFSTSGCRSSGGTWHCPAPSSTVMWMSRRSPNPTLSMATYPDTRSISSARVIFSSAPSPSTSRKKSARRWATSRAPSGPEPPNAPLHFRP